MRLAVIGSGYVGLVSGACFADFGHDVVCVDKDEAKIAALKRGQIPIFEPGLEALVVANAQQGRLSFTTDLALAVRGAEGVWAAVRGLALCTLSWPVRATPPRWPWRLHCRCTRDMRVARCGRHACRLLPWTRCDSAIFDNCNNSALNSIL